MRRAEWIVIGFAAFGEPGQPALLAQGRHPVPPPGQYLVRITLVANVPDQFVMRRIEHRMQGDGQFNNPQ